MIFLVQNVQVCLMGAAIQELYMYNYVSFPLPAGVPWQIRSSTSRDEWHRTTKSPPGCLKRSWGIKPPAE